MGEAAAELVSLAMAQTQSEQLAVLVDLAGAVEVVEQRKRLVEQGYSTFSTRKHYDL